MEHHLFTPATNKAEKLCCAYRAFQCGDKWKEQGFTEKVCRELVSAAASLGLLDAGLGYEDTYPCELVIRGSMPLFADMQKKWLLARVCWGVLCFASSINFQFALLLMTSLGYLGQA